MRLPSELQWLEWVVGSDWPEGDEDALWRLSEAWNQAAKDLNDIIRDGNRAAESATLGMDGIAADRFDAYWAKFSISDPQYLVKLAEQCAGIGKHCDATALEIEYAKYQFILALIVLAAQIAYMLAMAAVTFGASTAGIPVATAATQITVRIIAQRLLQSILMGIATNVGMDLAVQGLQIAQGHRDGIDFSKTGNAALDGAISGAISGGLGLGASKFAPNFAGTLLGDTVTEGVAGAASTVVSAAVRGESVSLEDIAKGGVSGGIGGAVDHGTDAARHGPGSPSVPGMDPTPTPGGPDLTQSGDGSGRPGARPDGNGGPPDGGGPPGGGDGSPGAGGDEAGSRPGDDPARANGSPSGSPRPGADSAIPPFPGGDSADATGGSPASDGRPSGSSPDAPSSSPTRSDPPASHGPSSAAASDGGGGSPSGGNRYSQALNTSSSGGGSEGGYTSGGGYAPSGGAPHASGLSSADGPSTVAASSAPSHHPTSPGVVPPASHSGNAGHGVVQGPSVVQGPGVATAPAGGVPGAIPGSAGVAGPLGSGGPLGASGAVGAGPTAVGASQSGASPGGTTATGPGRGDHSPGAAGQRGSGWQPRAGGEPPATGTGGQPGSDVPGGRGGGAGQSGAHPARDASGDHTASTDHTATPDDGARTGPDVAAVVTTNAGSPAGVDTAGHRPFAGGDADSADARPPAAAPVRLSDGTEYTPRYGPDSTPRQAPFERRVSDVVNDRNFPPEGPDDTRTPRQRFQDLKNLNADQLTEAQREAIAAVRDSETLQAGDVMSKVLAPWAAENYVANGRYHDSVRGFVARLDDVRPLDTPAAQFEGLGLDYTDTPFTPDQDHYYSVRWEVDDPSEYTTAYSGDMADAVAADPRRLTPIGTGPNEMAYTPYTGNGYTYSANHATPEFRTDVNQDGSFGAVSLPEGAEIWRVNADGSQSPVAVFRDSGWHTVGGADLSDLGGTPSSPGSTPGASSAAGTDPPASADPPAGTDPPADADASEPDHREETDPSDDQDQGSDSGEPVFVTDDEATRLLRDHVRETPSGYSFYPDGDETHQFANGVRPIDGVVNLDLHGSERGFHIDGRVMTGEQFARAIRQLETDGVLDLNGREVRLSACDVARGDNSPAARFARESGLTVTAPTERLWTTLGGDEVVSSPHLTDGRWVPGHPPDGEWRTFAPDGVESATNDGRPGSESTMEGRTLPTERANGPPTDGTTGEEYRSRAADWEHPYTAQDEGLTPTDRREPLYGRQLYVDEDGRAHVLGDAHGTYRDGAGFLVDPELAHRVEDLNKGLTEGLDQRAEHVRGSEQVIEPDDTPLLDADGNDIVASRQTAVDARDQYWTDNLARFEQTLAAHGVTMRAGTFEADFKTIAQEARHLLPSTEYLEFKRHSEAYQNLHQVVRGMSEQLGDAGGQRYVERMLDGGRVLTGDEGGRGTPGNADMVVTYRADGTPSLAIIENKGAGSQLGTRLVDNPDDPGGDKVRVQQGSTKYLLDILRNDNKLGPYLDAHPEMRATLTELIHSGNFKYLHCQTGVDGTIKVREFAIDKQYFNSGRVLPNPGSGS